MFDAGFLEMLVIGVIALVVVGPERLPGIARKVGKWVGKARVLVKNTRSDIEKEIRADEMRNMLIMQEEKIRSLQNSFEQSVKDAEDKTQNAVDDASSQLEQLNEALTHTNVENKAVEDKTSSDSDKGNDKSNGKSVN